MDISEGWGGGIFSANHNVFVNNGGIQNEFGQYNEKIF